MQDTNDAHVLVLDVVAMRSPDSCLCQGCAIPLPSGSTHQAPPAPGGLLGSWRPGRECAALAALIGECRIFQHKRILGIVCLAVVAAAPLASTPGVAELEAQLAEAERQGVSGPEIEMLRQIRKAVADYRHTLGAPRMRSITDMNGNRFEGRLLIVTLDGGRVMSLTHYQDTNGAALTGPHGGPRYRQ